MFRNIKLLKVSQLIHDSAYIQTSICTAKTNIAPPCCPRQVNQFLCDLSAPLWWVTVGLLQVTEVLTTNKPS